MQLQKVKGSIFSSEGTLEKMLFIFGRNNLNKQKRIEI